MKHNIKSVTKSEINVVKVAKEIAKSHEIIYSGNSYYEFQGGCYRKLDTIQVIQWIKKILGDDFSSHKVNETLSVLRADCFIKSDKLNSSQLLNIKNGLLDLTSFQLQDHNAVDYATIQLEVEYDRNSTCPKWERTLLEIFEADLVKINMLQEYFGLCLTKETKYQKALFMIGDGANGKSTILEVLMALLGRPNYSAIPLEKFSNSHYVANLFGKLANISIETNAKSEIYDSTFKAIVSGDAIEADFKFASPFTFHPFCKLIFALNNMPRVDDKTSAFFRRLIILRFDRVFEEKEQNRELRNELLNELSGILVWSLKGLERLRARDRFEEDTQSSEEVSEYRKDNNNVLVFVDDECTLDVNASMSKGDLYDNYQKWCESSGAKYLSKMKFGKELKKNYPSLVDKHTTDERKWEGIRSNTSAG